MGMRETKVDDTVYPSVAVEERGSPSTRDRLRECGGENSDHSSWKISGAHRVPLWPGRAEDIHNLFICYGTCA